MEALRIRIPPEPSYEDETPAIKRIDYQFNPQSFFKPILRVGRLLALVLTILILR
jgi:hypothetical protein